MSPTWAAWPILVALGVSEGKAAVFIIKCGSCDWTEIGEREGEQRTFAYEIDQYFLRCKNPQINSKPC